MMRRYIACMAVYILLLFSTTLHAGGQDCPVILPPQYGGTIDMWGTNYQPCTYKEWFITLPDDAQYALLEYQIDINTSGVIDYVQVFVPDGNNGETEVLGYDNMPMTGVLPVYTPNSTLHVVYLGATEDNNELYNGFKMTIHQTSETMLFQDQVFFKNVGIGITPKTRLHVNGFVRGDGTNGAVRIKTKTGVTELGAQSYQYSHFKTDRSAFLFNKPIKVEGGRIQSCDASGNAAALSLGYGDSTILSLTDTAIQMNAPLRVKSYYIDSLVARKTKVLDTLIVLGPIRGGQACGSLRIKTSEGRVDIGSTHWGFMHFYTDRPKFYFNKPLSVDSGKITSYPRIPLQLQTYNTTRMYLDTTGNVGIGTSIPRQKLHIVGGGLKVGNSVNAYERSRSVIQFGDSNYVQIGEWDNDDWLSFKANRFIFDGNKIGVKTLNPQATLDVDGDFHANEISTPQLTAGVVYVQTQGADFVFDDAYNLLPLNDLEKYVNAKKHLPDLQPAVEMQQNGISVGDMQTLLLQKIEELTLYIIQQDKEIRILQEKVKQLEQ